MNVGDRVRYTGAPGLAQFDLFREAMKIKWGIRIGDCGVVAEAYEMEPFKCVEVRFDHYGPEDLLLFGLPEELFERI